MTRLADFGNDVCSQFGEDGCIRHIFDVIGEGNKVAVEFGAGDGLSCSNTTQLWRDKGWRALLVEADAGRFDLLEKNTAEHDTINRHAYVTPDGPDSISALITGAGLPDPDFMSIDIDGDDYFVFQKLTAQPRVVAVEFNPTVPPHLEVRQAEPGAGFGASALALVNLARTIGYTFIGATYCNAFFVRDDFATAFVGYETNLTDLFTAGNYTYAVTDYHGRLVLVGQSPPWGAKDPLIEPLTANGYVTPATTDVEYIRRAFERVYGPAVWLTAEGLTPTALSEVLNTQTGLVCVDLERATLSAESWMETGREAGQYRTRQVGHVLAFIRKDSSS